MVAGRSVFVEICLDWCGLLLSSDCVDVGYRDTVSTTFVSAFLVLPELT